MDKQEIELTQALLELSNKILEDKQQEREASSKKSFYQTVITVVVIICFSALWLYEIHESYDCTEFEIENKASAIIEQKGDIE